MVPGAHGLPSDEAPTKEEVRCEDAPALGEGQDRLPPPDGTKDSAAVVALWLRQTAPTSGLHCAKNGPRGRRA